MRGEHFVRTCLKNARPTLTQKENKNRIPINQLHVSLVAKEKMLRKTDCMLSAQKCSCPNIGVERKIGQISDGQSLLTGVATLSRLAIYRDNFDVCELCDDSLINLILDLEHLAKNQNYTRRIKAKYASQIVSTQSPP